MAARRVAQSAPEKSALEHAASQLERVANLLALLAVKAEPQTEKMKVLAGAGFSVQEIAALLHTSPNNVSVQLHRTRKQTARKKARRGR